MDKNKGISLSLSLNLNKRRKPLVVPPLFLMRWVWRMCHLFDILQLWSTSFQLAQLLLPLIALLIVLITLLGTFHYFIIINYSCQRWGCWWIVKCKICAPKKSVKMFQRATDWPTCLHLAWTQVFLEWKHWFSNWLLCPVSGQLDFFLLNLFAQVFGFLQFFTWKMNRGSALNKSPSPSSTDSTSPLPHTHTTCHLIDNYQLAQSPVISCDCKEQQQQQNNNSNTCNSWKACHWIAF